MEATDILNLAMDNIIFIGPALLVFCGLMFAESMTDFLVRILKQARRNYRL